MEPWVFPIKEVTLSAVCCFALWQLFQKTVSDRKAFTADLDAYEKLKASLPFPTNRTRVFQT